MARRRGFPGRRIGGGMEPPSDRWANNYKYRAPFVIPRERVRGATVIELPIPFAMSSNRLQFKEAVVETDLFLNPYNKYSIHHRPIGNGWRIGIPPSVSSGFTSYDSGSLGGIGRVADVGAIFSPGSQGTYKYFWRLDGDEANRTIVWNGEGTGDTFNDDPGGVFTTKIPEEGHVTEDGDTVVYPVSTDGSFVDGSVVWWKQDGGPADLCVGSNQFEYTKRANNPRPGQAQARFHVHYPFNGVDYGRVDSFDIGFSAANIRWPAVTIRGFEVNDPDDDTPMYHAINFGCTRKGPGTTHLLNRRRTWPATGTDAISVDQNLGDIPYGTVITLSEAAAARRGTVCENNRQAKIFDALRDFGGYCIDGHGGSANGGPQLQPRIQSTVTREARLDLNNMYARLLTGHSRTNPMIVPIFDVRTYNGGNLENDPDVWTDDLPYYGGNGPRDPLNPVRSTNTAYDANLVGGDGSGYVETPLGYDIRLEDAAGNEIPYRRVKWDSAAGLFVAEIMHTALSDAVDTIGYIYVGEPDVTEFQNTVAQLVAPYPIWYDFDNRDDVGGRSDLALTKQGIGTATEAANSITEGSSTDFSGAAVLRRANALGTNNLTNGPVTSFTIRYNSDLVNVDSGIFNIGGFGGENAGVLALMYRAAGDAVNNVIRANLRRAAGTASLESAANMQATGWQLVHVEFNSTEGTSKIWINGVESSSRKNFVSGNALIGTQNINIGTGPAQTNAGSFDGRIDFLRFRNTTFPAGLVASEAEYYRAPNIYIAFGDFDSPLDANVTPVAIAMEGATNVNVAANFNVFARSIVPTGTVLTIVRAPTNGTAIRTNSNTRIQYTPTSLPSSGRDTLRFRLTNGTKVSEAEILIAVTSGTTVDPAEVLDTWTLARASNNRFTNNIVRLATDRSGEGSDSGGNYGMIEFEPFAAQDEVWFEFLLTYAPTTPTGFAFFDIETKRTNCTLNANGSTPTGFLQSGKIPGIGRDGPGTGGRTPRTDAGWSARSQYSTPNINSIPTNLLGKIRVQTYIYDQARTGGGGRTLSMLTSWPSGTQLYLEKGVTYRWTQRVKINTPNVADGELEHWVDGVRVFLNTAMRWRGPVASNVARIDGWKPHIYAGGNPCDGPTYDSYVKCGRFRVYTSAPNFSIPLPD